MIAAPSPLAPYASCDTRSKGRQYPEEAPRYRSVYQRDRDRIVHSTAFRRLVYKTQVFVNHEGDLFRTRLTHSIEVAQIARTIARALRLNETLCEAICLAHDLGHTPFGHPGQDALNACMRDYGGFEHNLQSLRVVDELEEHYAAFAGLNLTFETREGILKHCSLNNARRLGELRSRGTDKSPGRGKNPVVAPEIARIVIGSGATAVIGQFDFAGADQLLDELGVVLDGKTPAELRVLVGNRMKAVRTGGDHRFWLHLV